MSSSSSSSRVRQVIIEGKKNYYDHVGGEMPQANILSVNNIMGMEKFWEKKLDKFADKVGLFPPEGVSLGDHIDSEKFLTPTDIKESRAMFRKTMNEFKEYNKKMMRALKTVLADRDRQMQMFRDKGKKTTPKEPQTPEGVRQAYLKALWDLNVALDNVGKPNENKFNSKIEEMRERVNKYALKYEDMTKRKLKVPDYAKVKQVEKRKRIADKQQLMGQMRSTLLDDLENQLSEVDSDDETSSSSDDDVDSNRPRSKRQRNAANTAIDIGDINLADLDSDSDFNDEEIEELMKRLNNQL
jgi:hypothetical protein